MNGFVFGSWIQAVHPVSQVGPLRPETGPAWDKVVMPSCTPHIYSCRDGE